MKTPQSTENTKVQATIASTVTTELSRTSAVVISFAAAAIGCWATASLFAGTLASGGPLGLVKNFFAAVIG